MQRFLDHLLPPAHKRPMTGIEALQLKTLNIFIWGSAIVVALMRLALLFLGNAGQPGLYHGIMIYLLGMILILFLERYIPFPLISLAFDIFVIAAIFLADTELQIIQGETLPFFIFPIAIAGLLIRPWAGYVVAGMVCGFVSIEVTRLGLGLPNVPLFGLFFMVALAIHLSTSRLYQAMEQEQKKSHELSENEEKYHHLIDLLPVGIFIHQEEKIVLVNPASMKFTGATSPEQLIGTAMIDRIHPDFRPIVQERIRAALSEGKIAPTLEEKYYRLDGSTFYADVSGTPFTFNRKPAMLVVFEDVTERKQAQEAIALKNQHIQEMSQKLQEAQERERRLLAAELHDDLGQSLTSLKLLLELSSRSGSASGRQKMITEAREVVAELMEKVRALSLDLRPAVLDDFGLFAALRWLYDRFRVQTGLVIKCNYDSDSQLRLEPHVETAAFRIIQEALTNVARHADVHEVEVTISTEGPLNIEVADKGVGFDVDQVLQDTDGAAGLSGMQERARLLGGNLEILSKPNAGTRVVARLPLAGSAL